MRPEPNAETRPGAGADCDAAIPRLFLREPGWQVHLKLDSARAFCYATAPGEDYYHRLTDGEVYLQRGDERFCLPCAARRGLLSHEPRSLCDRGGAPDLDTAEDDYDVVEP
jgi:hypothetical protein